MTDRCRNFRTELQERLDGTLSEARRSELDRHLDGCETCRAAADELTLLRTATQALPHEIQPDRDLWPAVERRLEARPQPIGWWRRLSQIFSTSGALGQPAPLAVALAGVLALALAVWVWQEAPTTVPEPTAGAVPSSAASLRTSAELARFEDGMLLAHQDLLAAVELQTEHMSPETVAAIEENMRIIDQAIGQIRTALEDDPLNPKLNMLLAAQYQHEVELLKRLSGV